MSPKAPEGVVVGEAPGAFRDQTVSALCVRRPLWPLCGHLFLKGEITGVRLQTICIVVARNLRLMPLVQRDTPLPKSTRR